MGLINFLKISVLLIIICYLCGVVLLFVYMGLAIMLKWYNKLRNKYIYGKEEES